MLDLKHTFNFSPSYSNKTHTLQKIMQIESTVISKINHIKQSWVLSDMLHENNIRIENGCKKNKQTQKQNKNKTIKKQNKTKNKNIFTLNTIIL